MIGLAFVLALAVAPEPAPPRDNPHFDAAVAAWKERRWTEAADAFTRAYALDPRSEYVFARAQALRFSGACEAAIAVYREFIALEPPKGAVDEAREHIEACGGDLDDAPPPAEIATAPRSDPDPPVDAPVRAVTPSPSPAEPEPRPKWWRDPTGHVLGWTGLSAAAVGTGFVIEGLARRQRGQDALDEQGYRDARRGGASLLHAGIPLLSVGGALVIGAVIRFAVVARARRRHDRGRDAARSRARSSAGTRGLVVPRGVGVAWSP